MLPPDSAAFAACRRLNSRRNDLAHLRRGDRDEEFRTAHADLVTLLENAMFLCDLLRPFLIGGMCHCTHWSTFHVDGTPPGADVRLKSLEHGHTMSHPGLREALAVVGLL
ncbi:hypothetical protein [Actinoplanes subglobosus]|uniref:RiboL-PSP-HEPN domain-containing protein n=1 Tax=Actinoplanes subglobosus TaxID=1547892 RepID=A0ABV8J830_9ACTN